MSGKLHAVLVGNGTFPDDPTHLRDLRCPVRDVSALAEILNSEAHGGYVVTTVVDRTHDLAKRTVYESLKKAEPDDLVLLYFSGHGKLDEDGNLYLVTKDTVADALPPTSIPLDDIRKYLTESRASRKVVILDCCFSGAIKKLYKGEISDQASQAIHDFEGQGTFYLSAGTDVQLAEEKEGDEYSLLTKHILAGIKDGRADSNDDGRVTFQELCAYVQAEIPREGSQKPKAWFLEAEGDVTVAWTGKPARDARRKAITRKLYELGNRDLVTDDALAKLLQIINQDLNSCVTPGLTVKQLIDSLYPKLASVGAFLQEVARRTGEAENSQTSAPGPRHVAERLERPPAVSQDACKLQAISAEPEDKRKFIRYVAVVFGLLFLVVVGGFVYRLLRHTNAGTSAGEGQNIETGPAHQPSQPFPQPAGPAKPPATSPSETKKKTESHRRNAQANKSNAPEDSAPSSQPGGNSSSAQQNPAVTQSDQENNGLSLLLPSIRAKDDAQTNKSSAPDASVPSSQAGGDSGSAQQRPAVTQSAQPETKSNPSPDADAKIRVVEEAFREKDWEKVVSVSRQLANAGDPRGMYYLGRAYTLGAGVAKSWEQEKYWYEKSAAAGYCGAMYMLGISYNANGDFGHAQEWFRKGASAQPQDCADACAKRVLRGY